MPVGLKNFSNSHILNLKSRYKLQKARVARKCQARSSSSKLDCSLAKKALCASLFSGVHHFFTRPNLSFIFHHSPSQMFKKREERLFAKPHLIFLPRCRIDFQGKKGPLIYEAAHR